MFHMKDRQKTFPIRNTRGKCRKWHPSLLQMIQYKAFENLELHIAGGWKSPWKMYYYISSSLEICFWSEARRQHMRLDRHWVHHCTQQFSVSIALQQVQLFRNSENSKKSHIWTPCNSSIGILSVKRKRGKKKKKENQLYLCTYPLK